MYLLLLLLSAAGICDWLWSGRLARLFGRCCCRLRYTQTCHVCGDGADASRRRVCCTASG